MVGHPGTAGIPESSQRIFSVSSAVAPHSSTLLPGQHIRTVLALLLQVRRWRGHSLELQASEAAACPPPPIHPPAPQQPPGADSIKRMQWIDPPLLDHSDAKCRIVCRGESRSVYEVEDTIGRQEPPTHPRRGC
ncbi:hypothetical protein ACE41H_21500 [Paenibacillus enshidis]|uniref:Uncharacterized protein n=1 Tax=Paenibacillus enshidis TaxID=1458439 RepID=A0ABV5AYP2_9BACL